MGLRSIACCVVSVASKLARPGWHVLSRVRLPGALGGVGWVVQPGLLLSLLLLSTTTGFSPCKPYISLWGSCSTCSCHGPVQGIQLHARAETQGMLLLLLLLLYNPRYFTIAFDSHRGFCCCSCCCATIVRTCSGTSLAITHGGNRSLFFLLLLLLLL